MSAKDKSNLSKFIGVPYIRKSGSNGAWFELASARWVTAALDTTKKKVDVLCDTRWSVFKGTIPEGMITLTFLENCDTVALSKLFGLTENSVTAWAKTFPLTTFKFEWDYIELPFYSNDWLWCTSIVVKDSTWATTYVLDTDYTITVSWNKTIIAIKSWGGITANDSVQVSWGYNSNAYTDVELTSKFSVLPEFDVKIEAEIDWDSGKKEYRVITMDPCTLDSVYNMEFLDVVKAGNIQWASLTFTLSEWGKFKYHDEHLVEA